MAAVSYADEYIPAAAFGAPADPLSDRIASLCSAAKTATLKRTVKNLNELTEQQPLYVPFDTAELFMNLCTEYAEDGTRRVPDTRNMVISRLTADFDNRNPTPFTATVGMIDERTGKFRTPFRSTIGTRRAVDARLLVEGTSRDGVIASRAVGAGGDVDRTGGPTSYAHANAPGKAFTSTVVYDVTAEGLPAAFFDYAHVKVDTDLAAQYGARVTLPKTAGFYAPLAKDSYAAACTSYCQTIGSDAAKVLEGLKLVSGVPHVPLAPQDLAARQSLAHAMQAMATAAAFTRHNADGLVVKIVPQADWSEYTNPIDVTLAVSAAPLAYLQPHADEYAESGPAAAGYSFAKRAWAT